MDDEVLKAAFVRVYNEEFKDKGNFFKAFLANVKKVIGENNTSDIPEHIAALHLFLQSSTNDGLVRQING